MATPMAWGAIKVWVQTLRLRILEGHLSRVWIFNMLYNSLRSEKVSWPKCRLNQILDHPDPVNHFFSESFWISGVIPNFPKICTLVARKFPEHTIKLQLERVSCSLSVAYLLLLLWIYDEWWLISWYLLLVLVLMQVDKVAFDSLTDGAEVYLQNLEPWVQVWTLLIVFLVFVFYYLFSYPWPCN